MKFFILLTSQCSFVHFFINDIYIFRWTLPYLREDKKKGIERLLYLMDKEGMVDLKYTDYDWSLNNISPAPVQPVPQPGHAARLAEGVS